MFGRLTDPDPPPLDGPASAGPASAGPASAGPPPGGPPSVPPPLPPVLPAPELQATADPSPEPQATPIATAQTTAAKPCQPEPMPLLPSRPLRRDRKSTRLNSSHLVISYAVFCLKKKKKIEFDFLPKKIKKILHFKK